MTVTGCGFLLSTRMGKLVASTLSHGASSVILVTFNCPAVAITITPAFRASVIASCSVWLKPDPPKLIFITLAFTEGTVPELFTMPAAKRISSAMSKPVPPQISPGNDGLPKTLIGIIFVFQVTPATPKLLFVFAPTVQATCVPWKLLLVPLQKSPTSVGSESIPSPSPDLVVLEIKMKTPGSTGKVDATTGYRTRSLQVVPLKNQQGSVIGTFQVMDEKIGAFDKDDEKALQTLAEQAASAIQTAQLVEELKRRSKKPQQENNQLRKEVEERFSTQNIIETSPEIQNVVRLIEQISDSTANILISGESGTGKELLAKAIHYNGSRSRNPFVPINSAAIPDSLIEAELFGIEKGTATGVDARIGKFEEAQGWSLFLDEIGYLSFAAQAKILRVIQERFLQKVGGRKAIPIEVRILAATNKDLEAETKKGNFRKDLYYRLKEIQIHMPALREIPEDIPVLANHFLDKYCREMNKN